MSATTSFTSHTPYEQRIPTQTLALLPAQMLLSASSGAGSILDLAALALTLATFTAVVIAVVKK